MTLEQILDDLKTDRVKKCILDSDMYNEMDDQYALAYCLGCDKINLLSINAAPFDNGRTPDFETGMEASYRETYRVLEICHKNDGTIPVYEGSRVRYSADNNYAPVDSPAARNIIKTVKESDEIIYVLTTGCCSNVTSACLMDPSITSNMCVIWLGGHVLDHENLDEFNLVQDYAAGQLLINNDIPLILLPACSKDHTKGTQALSCGFEELCKLKGDNDPQKFFREAFPMAFVHEENMQDKLAEWSRVIWDLAAPGVISVPHAYTFSIIPAPIFCDNHKYAFDQTRHKIIYMERLDKNIVFEDTWAAINSL